MDSGAVAGMSSPSVTFDMPLHWTVQSVASNF